MVSAALVILAVTFAALLVHKALEITPNGKNTGPALTAGIAVTGALTTAGVALIGYVFRQSIDLRTTRIAEESSKRADVDQKRLQMQAAMDTVRLLATADGKPAPVVQCSAALIVLNKLGESGLAVDLAAELWPKEQLTASAAVALCDTAITSGQSDLRAAAILLLWNNWKRLAVGNGQAEWPRSLMQWPKDIDKESQDRVREILEAWCLHTPPTTNTDFRKLLLST